MPQDRPIDLVYDPTRYLLAKRTVDDRAINWNVCNVVRRHLTTCERPSILEIGGGVGSMIDRMLDWRMLTNAEYYLLDIDPAFLRVAEDRIPNWNSRGVTVTTKKCAVETWLTQDDGRRYDLVIAHAVLDVVNQAEVIKGICARLKQHGHLWLTINFDGETIFEPSHPGDDVVISAYHRSMDVRQREGQQSGDSRSGRHLFAQLGVAGAEVLAAGSSDWVVHSMNGNYPADESYFLQHILHFFEDELGQNAELDNVIAPWLAARRQQIQAGSLVYIAHQLDFVGRIKQA